MIKTLRKKISTLFVVLLGIIWFFGLAALNWVNFTNHVDRLRASVRADIRDMGWREFLSTGGESNEFELEELEYCVCQVREDGRVVFRANKFSSMTEEELMKYTSKLSQHWMSGERFWKVTYIYKYSKVYGWCLVLISSKEALYDVLPFMTVSVVAAVTGLFMLAAAARKLSGWLVGPVEESIKSEQTFMSNASHELKTPLTVIRTNVELLSDEIGENKRLRYIQMETERMVSLVNKMLTLVRLDTPCTEQNNQKFRMDEALLNVIYPMESVAYEKKIRMELQIEDKMWFIGNEEQIQSVMTILLDNAISYTPEGGCIEIHAAIHSRKFHLAVANTGEMIPKEQRDKLFERFYRQDEARESSSSHLGLGLAIADSIVANHHGKIRVECTDNKNIFHVMLPCVKK